MLRVASVGSGSGGNGLIVEAAGPGGPTRVLLDAGFAPGVLARRLAVLGLTLADLDAVLVTHEHSDHVSGLAALLRRHGLPVYASRGTAQAGGFAAWERFVPVSDGDSIVLGALRFEAFAVPHDSADPLQFTFGGGARRLGVATDLGTATPRVVAALSGVDALVLEFNHDAGLLATGRYPAFLKRRIAGDRGHLSNDQAAELLDALDRSALRWVACAHLSRSNNTPALARAALDAVLGAGPVQRHCLTQDEGLGWTEVG